MRKLKLQVQMTIDGFIAGPNGEMDWVTWNWDKELMSYVQELTDSIDCIVLGRKLATGFIPYWAGVASDPDNPENAAGIKFTETPKVVFSNTLKNSEWDNTILAKNDLVSEINALKNIPGKDIIAYGGAEFVSNLIKHNLIDDYHIFVNPAAIGSGMQIFDKLGAIHNLKLIQAKSFDCGIVLLNYNVNRLP
ncbi:MAG: deaminase [Ignavibacteriae bacterium HGW-Ignavibacteriae-1]|jgi:dihydrofolate reductase|nr:MAG: deaminase [Ignavibacteriae bacterium HGW-Ignavibacteriae-1]